MVCVDSSLGVFTMLWLWWLSNKVVGVGKTVGNVANRLIPWLHDEILPQVKIHSNHQAMERGMRFYRGIAGGKYCSTVTGKIWPLSRIPFQTIYHMIQVSLKGKTKSLRWNDSEEKDIYIYIESVQKIQYHLDSPKDTSYDTSYKLYGHQSHKWKSHRYPIDFQLDSIRWG